MSRARRPKPETQRIETDLLNYLDMATKIWSLQVEHKASHKWKKGGIRNFSTQHGKENTLKFEGREAAAFDCLSRRILQNVRGWTCNLNHRDLA